MVDITPPQGEEQRALDSEQEAAASASSATAAGRTLHGCPYGAFCIYPRSWHVPHRLPTGRPERGGILYTYGHHNLRGQYGWHYVLCHM